MPAKNPDAVKRKRERDNQRRREQRANPSYREAERERDRERKQQERDIERKHREAIRESLADFSKDWDVYDWENGYIRRRGGNEAYRPWLQALKASDMKRGTIRYCVYQTTPLEIEERAEYARVWQTYRSATIQVPGLPLVKRFKVLDPKDPNPIPIGEGELVRRYLASQASGRHVFPKSVYSQVRDSPKFFVPENPPDLLEFDAEYVDIARCYSQLLERLPSLGVNFSYGRRIFKPLDLPPHDKQLLASKHWGRATVGMLRQSHGRCFIYGEPKTFPSRFYHGDTSQWVHAILHCLAAYAINHCGCYRWHTDGGFFPPKGGRKFSKLLNQLGIAHTLEEYAAVIFASLDQYEAIRRNGSVKQTKLFTSTYVSDFVFLPASEGGAQRNNVIFGLNDSWLFSTLEQA